MIAGRRGKGWCLQRQRSCILMSFSSRGLPDSSHSSKNGCIRAHGLVSGKTEDGLGDAQVLRFSIHSTSVGLNKAGVRETLCEIQLSLTTDPDIMFRSIQTFMQWN